jgi:hypothetical protein
MYIQAEKLCYTVVFMGMKFGYLTLREEHKMGTTENTQMEDYFAPSGNNRRMKTSAHNEECHNKVLLD